MLTRDEYGTTVLEKFIRIMQSKDEATKNSLQATVNVLFERLDGDSGDLISRPRLRLVSS